MALDVGIVGLPGSGKTALFNALTRAAASEHEMKEHVGMAAIADDRLDRLAVVESSAKITPATIRLLSNSPDRRKARIELHAPEPETTPASVTAIAAYREQLEGAS